MWKKTVLFLTSLVFLVDQFEAVPVNYQRPDCNCQHGCDPLKQMKSNIANMLQCLQNEVDKLFAQAEVELSILSKQLGETQDGLLYKYDSQLDSQEDKFEIEIDHLRDEFRSNPAELECLEKKASRLPFIFRQASVNIQNIAFDALGDIQNHIRELMEEEHVHNMIQDFKTKLAEVSSVAEAQSLCAKLQQYMHIPKSIENGLAEALRMGRKVNRQMEADILEEVRKAIQESQDLVQSIKDCRKANNKHPSDSIESVEIDEPEYDDEEPSLRERYYY